MKFNHLHVHSHYSLLDGLAKIDDLVAKAKADGMEALALTDHGSMYGVIEFYQKCKAQGIKPIIGVEAYLAATSLSDKSQGLAAKRYHVILLAQNDIGYRNLIKLTTIAHLEGFYYKPRIDWELLKKHADGIVCLSACLQGELPEAILRNDEKKAEEVILKYKELFGDRYFLEVQHHPNIPDQKKVNAKIFELGKKHEVPIVATNDIHYLNTEDAEAHDILICLQTKKKIADTNRMSMLGEDFSFFTTAQMADFFRGNPEVIENTNKVVEMCNLEIELNRTLLPSFDLPADKTAAGYLRELCEENFQARYGFELKNAETKEQKEISTRLDFELETIEKMGFSAYFLIVQDFINWAKKSGIAVGPGRGSAAGSIVAYLTKITDIDPIAYDLLFERFLNPDRISMPDIDTDFADKRRDEVLKYTEEKYGKDHVAQIITFGTMAARAAVRDVGRVLDLPYSFCDQISKLIPMSIDLDEAINNVAEVRDMYSSNSDAKRLLDFAKKLEGVARHASTHACGVVIAPMPLDNFVPCQYSTSGDEAIVSQYSLHPIEDLGLLKMDFLGLKNLTIIEQAIEIIEAVHKISLPQDEIPLDDEKTYRLFQEGKTTGVFQFESGGMKRYLRQLSPERFEDIIAMVALYRPGPMQFIDTFIKRKSGGEKITYLHPSMERALAETYGVTVYQEQVMALSKDMAGFTGGQADTLRKAIGKKKADLMAKMKDEFIVGCQKNKIDKRAAEEVWKTWEAFAQYCFNKSHAACYAMISYRTAYLKANYPAEFMASLLTSDLDNMERVAIEIDECSQLGIEILPPDVNESFGRFAVVKESLSTESPKIRFGLSAIRNVGDNVSKAIIAERKANGQYQRLEDFLLRLENRVLNKKSIEGLIKSGALDRFGDRNYLNDNIDKMLFFLKETEKDSQSNQVSLFSSAGPTLRLRDEITKTSKEQILSWEREFLGLYVSEHPFKMFENELAPVITKLIEAKQLKEEGQKVRVAGVVTGIKKILTKKGDPMLFVKIEDAITGVELLVFPKIYQETMSLWQEEKILVVEGSFSIKDGDPKVLVNQVFEINEQNKLMLAENLKTKPIAEPDRGKYYKKKDTDNSPNNKIPQVVLAYPKGATKEQATAVKKLFLEYPGEEIVVLKIGEKMIRTNFKIAKSEEFDEKYSALIGLI
ncbi:MAG TPA: DNA polymerase III subunit alpha [Candidatus Bipolaricaulota bacterium]|nr:DNA polymerase III subunit alpha [Candidatus Bipolaricaulota bacterium]